MLHQLVVPPEAVGERLDVFLETRLEGCSRSLVARCIKAGRCQVAPGTAKPAYRLRGGEGIAIEVPEIEPLEAVPEDIPLRILHEDADLVGIDKPPGMVVHPAIGHPRGTLGNALLGRYGPSMGGETWRPGLIHRLDADTSGVIAVAKHPQALQRYQDAFRERRVTKRYLAMAHGAPPADVFEQRSWLGRHPKDFRKRCVRPDHSPGAKPAHTGFVVRQRHDGWCVLECRLHTGRTHQIRVHLAAAGHPILADATYGRSDRWPLTPGSSPMLQRQALHAWLLELPRPAGGVLRIKAPIPADLAPWISGELACLVD
jgi:23S rRNA pseudouridine1911/1915/1917 synthase